MLKPCLIIFCWAVYTLPGYAQFTPADTLFLSQANQNEVALYSNTMVGQSHLYNGTEYREYNPLKDEHPFFISDWTDGSVFYDGEFYKNAVLLYDINKDQVIVEHYSSRQKIELFSNWLEYFNLNEHYFVHLRNEQLPKGFYELVYDGATKVYMKRLKMFLQELKGTEIHRSFDEKQLYYIFRQGNFYSVKNKKTVVKALQDHKAELNQFIGKNHIKFKANKEKSIAMVAEYYDSINK